MEPRLRAAPRELAALAVHAGEVEYARAWGWQHELVERRAVGNVPDVLLTLEHPRVFTAGKRSDPTHLLWSEAEREARGVDFHEVDRGGDVTYHGPGQLVAYPIVQLDSLRGVVDYVRALERVCVAVAADLGISAAPVEGLTGVWVGREKLVAIGVRVSSRGVTSHGLAFNVTTDLADFAGIVPCGIADRGVCSLRSLGVDAGVADVLARLRVRFAEVFDAQLDEASVDALGLRDAVTVA